jgi:hypothetical protein
LLVVSWFCQLPDVRPNLKLIDDSEKTSSPRLYNQIQLRFQATDNGLLTTNSGSDQRLPQRNPSIIAWDLPV